MTTAANETNNRPGKKWRLFSSWIFVAVVVLLPISVFALVKFLEKNYQPLPYLGPAEHEVADFKLYDQNAQLTTREAWKGKIVVAHFFFTHCPVVCPKMIYQLKRVQAYSKINNLQIASFTVDPERDSSSKLQSYAGQWNIAGSWQLLTGDKQQLYRLARKSFLVTATDGDGGPEDFIHSESLVLIDTKNKIRGFYQGTSAKETDKLINDIKKLALEK